MSTRIQKYITATVRTSENEIFTFNERMTADDISVTSVISRRFSELHPNVPFSTERISIEIVSENVDTGNQTVLTRFFV